MLDCANGTAPSNGVTYRQIEKEEFSVFKAQPHPYPELLAHPPVVAQPSLADQATLSVEVQVDEEALADQLWPIQAADFYGEKWGKE